MKAGFTFKNRHSGEFGITVKTKSRPIVPEQKIYSYDIPLMDGEYDMTSSNPYGRPFYKNRLFELELSIAGASLGELQHKAARIASWLTGNGELIFDDTSACKWNTRVCSDVSFVPEHRGRMAKMNVVFRVDIGEATFNTADGIKLSDGVRLDSDLPLDISVQFEKTLIKGKNQIDFINIGDYFVRPMFEFTGEAKSITVNSGSKSITVQNPYGSGTVIDFEKCRTTSTSGYNLLSLTEGDFFEFSGGKTQITVSVDAQSTLIMHYTPRTIYNFNFTDIDWGES